MPIHVCRHPEGLPLGQLNFLQSWPRTHDQEQVISLMSHGLEEGLSRHGAYYLAQNQTAPSISNVACELLFEQIRQRFYPDRPSRLQSFFALSDIASIDAFPFLKDSPDALVYEVSESSTASSFTGNMNLLTIEDPGGFSLINAHDYWQGKQGRHPAAWEILIPGTVHIKKVLGTVALLTSPLALASSPV